MVKAQPLLQVQEIFKSYPTRWLPLGKKRPVLRGASLHIHPGQLVGLVGENGSGKSTLLKIIAGVLPADGGTVSTSGRVGYCPQEPILFDKLTVAETFQLFGTAYRLPKEALRQRAAELLERLRFPQYHETRVEQLSGGTRQKLNLSIALLHSPSLLLLDEPYAGFDYETYLQFWELALQVVRNGNSILIISHFINERERFDRLYAMQEGRCVPL